MPRFNAAAERLNIADYFVNGRLVREHVSAAEGSIKLREDLN